jgi:hypothetical protein
LEITAYVAELWKNPDISKPRKVHKEPKKKEKYNKNPLGP